MKNIDIVNKLTDNLGRLKSFSVVARMGSITRATEVVHLSQSALSHAMAKLEEDLDVQLFIRKPHGLELTPEGIALLRFSQRVLIDVENFANNLSSQKDQFAITLKIGTHETLAAHVWPPFIKKIYESAENTRFAIHSGRIDGLVQMLLRGELHAVLGVEPQNISQLDIRPVYSGHLEFFAARDFLRKIQKRVNRKILRPRDFAEITIFTDSHAHTRQGIGIPMALADVGFDNLGQFEITSFDAAINLASQGLGIAVIPDRNAETAVKSGIIVPLKIEGLRNSNSLKYRICLSTLRNSPYDKVIQTLYLQLESILGGDSDGKRI